MHWMDLLYLLASGLLVWVIIRTVRRNPSLFTRETFSKSVFTFGVLALLLIVVIGFCVMILRN